MFQTVGLTNAYETIPSPLSPGHVRCRELPLCHSSLAGDGANYASKSGALRYERTTNHGVTQRGDGSDQGA